MTSLTYLTVEVRRDRQDSVRFIEVVSAANVVQIQTVIEVVWEANVVQIQTDLEVCC